MDISELIEKLQHLQKIDPHMQVVFPAIKIPAKLRDIEGEPLYRFGRIEFNVNDTEHRPMAILR